MLWWLSIGLLLKPLLVFDEVDIVISRHALTVTVIVPWRIWDLLHLEQCIWCYLIFNFCILILLVQVLAIIFLWIHKADVFFQLLDEGFRKRFR